MSRRVALALGSGGARGYAHIGVIEEIRARGHEIVGVAGTSMGALVGGLHAAGRLDGFTEWVCGLSQARVIRLLDPSLKGPGVIRAEKVMARVRSLLGGALIEDLPIPFTAVATDLLARREVWFQRGPVDVAIRASIALPTVITPVIVKGRLLADGGLLNPIPIAPLISEDADLIVAVSLSGPGRLVPEEPEAPAAGHLGLAGMGEVDTAAAPATSPSTREVVDLSLRAMQHLVTRYRLAGYAPDLLISIPHDACGTLEFHRAAELIELGRAAARAMLDGRGI